MAEKMITDTVTHEQVYLEQLLGLMRHNKEQ
jgi:hypothetical protein